MRGGGDYDRTEGVPTVAVGSKCANIASIVNKGERHSQSQNISSKNYSVSISLSHFYFFHKALFEDLYHDLALRDQGPALTHQSRVPIRKGSASSFLEGMGCCWEPVV